MKTQSLKYTLLLLFLFGTASFVFPGGKQQYFFKQYSVEQGLPQSQVNFIYEDSRGFMWFATQGGGVARFDGKNFLQYEEADGLAGQIITGIAEDGNGDLWFGTSWGGVSHFNGTTFKNYDQSNGLPINEIKAILYDKTTKEILIGTGKGLTVYNYQSFQTYSEFSGIKPVEVSALHQLIDGRVLIGTNTGAFVKNGNEFIQVPSTAGMEISAVGSDSTQLWFVSPDGLSLVNLSNLLPAPIPAVLFDEDFFDPTTVSCVHYDEFGQTWLGTVANGVYLIRNNRKFHFDKLNGLPEYGVQCILTDRSGKTWMGTRGAGIIQFNGFSFNYFSGVKGLGLPDVFSIARDHSGRLWFASLSEGLFVYHKGEIEQFTTGDGLISNSVRMIVVGQKGELLIGTRDGFSVYNGKKFTNYTVKDGLPNNYIRCLLQSRKGEIWLGTGGGGVAVFDGKTFKTFSLEEGLNHTYVHSLLEDSKGNIWVGTGAGLNKFSDGVFSSYSVKHGLCNSYVGSMVEDRFGNIWVGTDKCISRFNGRRFTNYDVKDGLTSGTVYLMAMDHEGNMIVGTNKGFDKIRFTAYGQISGIRNYSSADGFTGIECNNKSVFVDQDGSIWFGTVKGVIRYVPFEEPEDVTRPNIHISGVKLFYDDKWLRGIDDDKLNWFGIPEDYVFRHDQNNISFSYTGICMSFPNALEYSYMMEGFDKNWSPLSSTEIASYSNLPPGKYVFRVKAKSKNGLWSIPDARFTFSIRPAFWQTWWFFLILLISLVYGMYYINTLMQRNVLRQNELLEEKVNLRTHEILKQKEEKEILLKEIHHRVKNNMQVIVSLLNIHADYIKDPESLALIEDSKSRIKSMALIHEKLYETKNFSKVNISEYLEKLVQELVDTYGIHTRITIDKKVEGDSFGFDTIIPFGLLLNEIVSNSLKYAFPGRDKGTIFFHLQKQGDKFELLIGDDGIGMPKVKFEESNKTLGVDLIRILTEQLNGTIELMEGEGTRFRIVFESIDKQRI